VRARAGGSAGTAGGAADDVQSGLLSDGRQDGVDASSLIRLALALDALFKASGWARGLPCLGHCQDDGSMLPK